MLCTVLAVWFIISRDLACDRIAWHGIPHRCAAIIPKATSPRLLEECDQNVLVPHRHCQIKHSWVSILTHVGCKLIQHDHIHCGGQMRRMHVDLYSFHHETLQPDDGFVADILILILLAVEGILEASSQYKLLWRTPRTVYSFPMPSTWYNALWEGTAYSGYDALAGQSEALMSQTSHNV